MKRVLVIILFLFSLASVIQGVNSNYSIYYKLVSKADNLKANNDYNAAIKLYDSAFSLAYPFPEDMLERLKCYELSGQLDKIPNALIELVQHGYKFREVTPILASDTMLLRNFPLKDEYIIAVKTKYDSLRRNILYKQEKYENNFMMHCFRTYANSLPNIKKFINNDSIFENVKL